MVEILLGGWVVVLALLPAFGQPQQRIILNILQLNLRNPTLNNPPPKPINMRLQQRHGPNQQIITSTNQIHKQQHMIPHQTVHPLIVGDRVAGMELYYYFLG